MKIKEIAFVCCAVSDMSRARTPSFTDLRRTGIETRTRGRSGSPIALEYDIGRRNVRNRKYPDWPVSPDGMSVTFEVRRF